MLLSIMRRHAKSWLIKLLIAIIAVVFVFYFGYSFTAKQVTKIAYVNGEIISGLEYQKAYWDLRESLQKKYKDLWNENFVKLFDLKNRALQGLIDRKLVSQEAKRLGLDVTEEEVQQAIINYQPFQTNGTFDMSRYKGLLAQNRLEADAFEADMARRLLDSKLQQFLFGFLALTEKELVDFYTYSNEKVKVSYVTFQPESFKHTVSIDLAKMKDYFEKNKEGFRIPEKIRLAYIEIDPANFNKEISVKEEQVKDYYEYHIDSFSEPKKVKARHILFRLDPDAVEEKEKEVRTRAREVLEKARQGEDFAELAKKYSEGPTKENGGDLGYFSPGQMDKSFDEAVFSLKKGEISEPVRTRFGYHIILAEELKEAFTRSLEDVHREIEDTLRGIAGGELAHERGLILLDQMPYDIDLAEYAKEHELEAKQTEPFSINESIPGIDDNEKLRQSLFALKGKETSDLIELGGKFYIFQVSERKDSSLPEFDEVTEKVEEAFVAFMAAEQAKAKAREFLNEIKQGKAWDQAAEEMHVEPQMSEFFRRLDPIAEIGATPQLMEMVFSLNKDRVYPEDIYENEKGVFVFRWEDHQDIDAAKYEEEKEQYRLSLMRVKQGRAYENWLNNLRKNAEIEIVTPVSDDKP